jgi:glycosyltransferase involved in cell wall biosynthesis
MTRRLRVLTLIDHLTASGGAETLAAAVALGLDPTRFERKACATRDADPAVVERLRAARVAVTVLRRQHTLSLGPWLRLIRLLRRERVDILHAHKFGSNLWGVVLGRLARVPVVVAHEHTWSYEGRPVRKFLDRRVIAAGADAFLAVSEADRDRMISLERIPPRLVRVVPNGIPPLPPPSGKDLRADLGIPPDAPVVIAVGLLRAQKAFDHLIRAAAALAAEHPGLRVLIAGGGPELESLEALVREVGLTATVMLLGGRDDVPDLLAAADVAVSSSDFEGTPLAVLEYMAAGKAIVATNVGGIPGVIEDGVQGVLVPPRDVEALAAAVTDLLRDPQRRARFGAAARERQQREFTVDATVRRVEELYAELWQARQ